ncbi:MAG TPA: TetR/AcrR family transcriptional regulator [Candidatus Angelobacter sp.]|jgi:AcrR family transcriptional regulator|nr:TetR/AcrR family transcriptional regulator [Candidatus Angelobacter sp.]
MPDRNQPNPLAPGLSPSAQQRAQQIVDAAARVMGRQGYGGTTMKDIAAEAGITAGLIHYYFDSKEDLLLAVTATLCEQMRRDAEQAFAASGDATPFARAWVALQAAKDHLKRPNQQRLFVETITLALSEPRMREQMAQLYEALLDSSTAMVEELAGQVPTPPPVPARDLAAVLVAAIDGMALQKLLDPSRDEDALYRAFGFLMMSCLAMSYAVAGLPVPTLEDFAAIIGGSGQ